MYMLNLLVNYDVTNGNFSDHQGGKNLEKSNHWLEFVATILDPEPTQADIDGGKFVVDDGSHTWHDVGEDVSVIIKNNPGVIAIRIMPDPTQTMVPDPSDQLQLVVAFGGTLKRHQPPQTSPFPHPTTGNTRSTFVLSKQKGAAQSWVFVLADNGDPINQAPHGQGFNDRYQFAVGAVLQPKNSAALERHYGEDPEMDVPPSG